MPKSTVIDRADGVRAGLPADAEAVAEAIRRDITEGRWLPHAPLPSYRTLAEGWRVSRRVVNDAVDTLVREGIVYRRAQRGTFVSGLTPAGRPEEGAALRCLTILDRRDWEHPGFVKGDYAVGYSLALEPYAARLRFMMVPDEPCEIASLLSAHHAPEEQGGVLVNISASWVYERLQALGVPFVAQNQARFDWDHLPPHASVMVNKTGAGFRAVQHLLDLGHRRIGFIGRTAQPGDRYPMRLYEGYCAAMNCAGLRPRPGDLLDYHTDEQAAAAAPVAEYLRRPDLPTAVFTETDSMALALLSEAARMGLSVPEQLSVVGYNDEPGAERSAPPLTTVRNPRVALARTAAEMVLAADGAGPTRRRIIEAHLVIRATTSRPTAGRSPAQENR